MAKNSRREFLKTVGAGSVAAGWLKPAFAATQPSSATLPAELPVTLNVNGRAIALTLEPRVTLLAALRDSLDLTGTKRLCDRATCGACTVIVDGRTHYACSLLAVDVQGRSIRTVESLTSANSLHPVQQAFCDRDVMMCGFCTPGCVMSAVALTERTAAPTPEQLRRSLDGHLCRCGVDLGALGALGAPGALGAGALGASGAMGAPGGLGAPGALGAARSGRDAMRVQSSRFAWPEKPRVLGTQANRVEGPAKVTGRARFTHDILRPGMLHAKVLRSPHPHARIRSIDVTPAAKAPGVRAVIVLISQGQKVLYAGEEVAAVAATSELLAADAARLIKVDWDVLPHLATVEQAMRPEAPNVFEPANTRAAAVQEAGDIDAGWRSTTHYIDGLYSTQVQTHVSPETHSCVCEWNGALLTAWISTQAVHGTRESLASALNTPAANVRVIAEHVGGGFGSKLVPGVEAIACARLARSANAPVKLVLDRKEEHLATGSRSSAFAQVRAGITADGLLTTFEAQTWGSGGAGAAADFPLPYIYIFPHRRREHADVYINAGPRRPMRGADHPQGCFITEVVIDELADAIRIDPLTVRLRNLPPPGPSAMWHRYFPIGAERIGWSERHPSGDPTPGPIKRGLGCAAHRWTGSGQGTRARCEIHPDGTVVIRCGTQDIGTGTRTLIAMVAAETLGLPPSRVRVEIGDTQLPISGPSMASGTAAAVSSAVRVATTIARDQLIDRIAPFAKGAAAAQALAWSDACRLLGKQPVIAEAQGERGLSGAGSSGVQFADVEVDVETGITRVRRIVCVQDCGLIIDRRSAESQCHGGIVAGLNYALYEERILDRNTGHMVNPNLEFYALARPVDVPPIEVILIDQPSRGVIGVGDPPTIATAAAIANAVRNATGVAIRGIPITPETLLKELERAGGTN